jgi:hypothetical protein
MSDADRMHRAYILECIRLHRIAMGRASAASAAWEKASEEINDWLDRSHIDDPVTRADARSKNLMLKGAFEEATYWQQECIRLSSGGAFEIAAREAFRAE